MKIELPSPSFRTAEDVASYAVRCFVLLHLAGWSFGFDRAARRLGCCRPAQKSITLSRHFTALYLELDPAQIHRTLLHELAHALAWHYHRSHGHGAVWRRYCVALGIADERATTRCADFSPRPYRPMAKKWALCHDETGEVFARYARRPKRSARQWKRCYIPGRKAETLGHLVLRELAAS